jgi:UDP-glucose 4-epimerase
VVWCGATVLVTGATGFIGKPLVRELCRLQARVVALTRSKEHNSTVPAVEWRRVDLCNFDEVRKVFTATRPDYVLHLSSLANGARNMPLVLPTLNSDLLSTVHLLIACADSSVKRILLPGSLEEPMPGDAPSSPYAAAKAASRSYARMFHLLYQTPVVIARIFMTYGPGQPDWKLIPYTIGCLLRGETPRIKSGERKVDWIFISDVVEGLLASLAASGTDGRTVDIGSGELVQIRQIIDQLRDLAAPALPVIYEENASRAHEQIRRAAIDDTLRLTGWQPCISLPQGLARTVEFLRARG